jgi:hypothetical protein
MNTVPAARRRLRRRVRATLSTLTFTIGIFLAALALFDMVSK